MDTRIISFWSMPLLAWALGAGGPLLGDTISATYSFAGSAHNEVIANGFLTADGVASGSVNGFSGVVFDTHNRIDLSTLQNYGTFTMIFSGGDTAFGNLHENDVHVSLVTFSGPFTQTLTFTGGTGQFADASGRLSGGGFIYPMSYTTSGSGTLTGPNLVASPEPASGVLLLVGLSIAFLRVFKRTLST
ncbi:MAG: hypothetical protein M3Y72_05740 [Acidobacteriota bacterium]|nr:hypothetical protein [Acidobacteriota bacterium]